MILANVTTAIMRLNVSHKSTALVEFKAHIPWAESKKPAVDIKCEEHEQLSQSNSMFANNDLISGEWKTRSRYFQAPSSMRPKNNDDDQLLPTVSIWRIWLRVIIATFFASAFVASPSTISLRTITIAVIACSPQRSTRIAEIKWSNFNRLIFYKFASKNNSG